MTTYPEHEKQHLIMDQQKSITDFLEWAESEGYDFGRTVTTRVAVFQGAEDVTAVVPAERSEVRGLLAKHFGIDLATIEAEKEQMIADHVALNRKGK